MTDAPTRWDELPADAVARIDLYVDLLLRWNERHNLTGFHTRDEVVRRGVEDALCAGVLLPGAEAVVDVGSGGGFPAVPLAALEPERRWVLLEPRRKRAAFLREACRVMELGAVEVVQQRLQSYPGSFPLVTSRAVGGITDVVAARLDNGGSWIRAMSDEAADAFSHPALQITARRSAPIPAQCWVCLSRLS